MKLGSLPLFDEVLSPSTKSILIAGAGGGYDVFSGVPLYFALKYMRSDIKITFANLSFMHFPLVKDHGHQFESLTKDVQIVIYDPKEQERLEKQKKSWGYFPELSLSEWFFVEKGESRIPVCMINRTGFQGVSKAYSAICRKYDIDTILLVDGGTDSLMKGDEEKLGTPEEDSISIASAFACPEVSNDRKFLSAIGFHVDSFHGVSHWLFLENVAEHARNSAFLGAFSLLREMGEAKEFDSLCRYVFQRYETSIVATSIHDAIQGHYGDHHSTSRTRGGTLWINPIMAMYWGFRLQDIAESILYLDELKKTSSIADVRRSIHSFLVSREQNGIVVRKGRSIPA